MNWIWGGLILVSIVFATASDIYDEIHDTHQNDRRYEARIVGPSVTPGRQGQSISLILLPDNIQLTGIYQVHGSRQQIRVEHHPQLNRHWQSRYGDDKAPLTADIVAGNTGVWELVLPPVRWQKLNSMMQAGFDMAEFAAKLALGLIGLMALWLGLMKIAEKSGLIDSLVRLVRPLLKHIFPDVPENHPAMGAISLNLSANILGLGNAATPMGIKAMQHLQELNDRKDTASDSMCMFLALNTSSVQLLPPVTVIALLGVHASGLFLSIFLATLCSTVVAFLAARWFAKHSRDEDSRGE